MSSINLTIRSTRDWRGEARARQLVEGLLASGDFWVPEKIDNREPERFAFDSTDLSKLIELWTSDISWVYLKRRKPHVAWQVIRMFAREARKFNELAGGFDERYFKKEDNVTRLLSGARRLYEWAGVTHGYITHEQDWKDKNYLGVPTRLPSGRTTSTGGLWLEDGLPGIYWANFFGPPYVEFFGADRLRSVPAYHTEEMSDGGYLLLTAPNPMEYAHPEVRALERQIIEHLGRGAFFDRSNPQAQTRAPRFVFEQFASGQPAEVIAFDPVVQAIPDVKQFLATTSMLADGLARRMRTQLAYTPESLNKVDDFIVKRARDDSAPWANPNGQQVLQELTAYYGEVLCRNLGGRWQAARGSEGDPHPAIALPQDVSASVEYPFTRVIKLWLEKSLADGLAIRYHTLTGGQVRRVEQFLKNLGGR